MFILYERSCSLFLYIYMDKEIFKKLYLILEQLLNLNNVTRF